MGNVLREIGPLELEVIGVLHSESDLSVTEIQARLKGKGHPLAYTTVMTVLVRLHQKGLVSREKSGRQFLYTAAKRKESSATSIFERVKKSLFGSERLKPILCLLESEDDLSREELEALKNAVETRLKKRGRT